MSIAGVKPSLAGANSAPAIPLSGTPGALPIEPLETLSPDAAKAWALLLPDLIETGVFRAGDAIWLVELCEQLAAAKGYREEVSRLQPQLDDVDRRAMAGEIEPTDAARAGEYLSARLKRARSSYLQTMKAAQSLAGEWGVSPVARIRLGLMRAQGTSLLSALGNADD